MKKNTFFNSINFKVQFLATFTFLLLLSCNRDERDIRFLPQELINLGMYWDISENDMKKIFIENNYGWGIEPALGNDSCNVLEAAYFSDTMSFNESLYESSYVLYFFNNRFVHYTYSIDCKGSNEKCSTLFLQMLNQFKYNKIGISNSNVIDKIYIYQDQYFKNHTYKIQDKDRYEIQIIVFNIKGMPKKCL